MSRFPLPHTSNPREQPPDEQPTSCTVKADGPLHIALRAYVLVAAIALGPSLFSTGLALVQGSRRPRPFRTALLRELGPNGLPFALSVAIGGGQYIQRLWKEQRSPVNSTASTRPCSSRTLAALRGVFSRIRNSKLTGCRTTFIANAIASAVAIALLQRRRWRSASSDKRSFGKSPTMDLTLLLLVRAVDALVQSKLLSWKATFLPYQSEVSDSKPPKSNIPHQEKSNNFVNEQTRTRIAARLDALIFWACSARYVVPWIV